MKLLLTELVATTEEGQRAIAINRFLSKLRGIQIFSLIFTAIFLAHLPLLRLPYFWDEAGYYIPAAYEFFTSGHLVPQSVPSNAHPPLPAIYLAVWWKLSAFKPAVTRVAMLLLAALALTSVFRLSRMLANSAVAVAVTLCAAVYPVWFAQSSLAHSDLPAAAFVLAGLVSYFRTFSPPKTHGSEASFLEVQEPSKAEPGASIRGVAPAAALFAIAALCKETAVVIPFALSACDLAKHLRAHHAPRWRGLLPPLVLGMSALPLALWFVYHHHKTGFFFGNPEFFFYNVSGTLTPLRIVLSIGLRLWQMLGYMNLWLLTLATVWVMRYPALPEKDGTERNRIALAAQYRIAAILLGNLLLFSLVGGAVLARYLLPVYPLVILVGISTLRRRLREWTWGVAFVALGFTLALFSNPFGYIPPEDNLSYRNYVILHKQAADYLGQHFPRARVLTAWTATDELTKPFLGYVRAPMSVVRIEDFSYDQLQVAQMGAGQYDLALLFSTKQQPAVSLLDHWTWWQRVSERYFGFHRDMPPQAAAQILNGRVIWEGKRGQQWAAIVNFERVENAGLRRAAQTAETISGARLPARELSAFSLVGWVFTFS